MRLLLGTHSLLWFIDGNPRLSQTARGAIEDLANNLFLSAASLWEIAIKVSLGKLTIPTTVKGLVESSVAGAGITLLAISPDHVDFVSTLPFHHRDPFDRLIISQALVDDMTILGNDQLFDAYSVPRLW